MTIEQVSERSLRVRKSDGQIVPFDYESVRKGIRKATIRKYEESELDRLVAAVFADAYARSDGGVVTSAEIGGSVLAHLKEFDSASHIRFALVDVGRRDRSDGRRGWHDAEDVRAWLLDEYPALDHWRPPGRLVTVVKRDGSRQPFDRKKLEQSIGYASKGRDSREEIERLATRVARDVERALGDQPLVSTGQLAAEILRTLRDYDHIAYMRYASATKRFADEKDYEAEAVSLRKRERSRPRSRNRLSNSAGS